MKLRVFTPTIALKICKRLASGESLKVICSERDMPARATVCEWIMRDVMGFRADYEAARACWFDEVFEEIIDMADALLVCEDSFTAQKLRMSINEKKWIVARNRAAPKRQNTKALLAKGDPDLRRTARQKRSAEMAAQAYRDGKLRTYNRHLLKFLNRGGDGDLLRRVIEGRS